ncbi:hypothetical protein GCM10009745_80210 [Kribbella yunnanensis]|uniref:Uncharacterized protein n=1 Tax=Kribbella yunnanensis TaxID=190194 RepID=A0ABN2J6V1_9ACTN
MSDPDCDCDVLCVVELVCRHGRGVDALELKPDPAGKGTPVRPFIAFLRGPLTAREQVQAGVNTGAVAAILDHDAALAQQRLKLRHVPVFELIVLAHSHHALQSAKAVQSPRVAGCLRH